MRVVNSVQSRVSSIRTRGMSVIYPFSQAREKPRFVLKDLSLTSKSRVLIV